MLLRRVNKRQVILNNIFRFGDTGRFHSLKFDFLESDKRWRIAPSSKDFGRIGWPWLWVLGISILIYTAISILRSRV
jgi:hypothetical protein